MGQVWLRAPPALTLSDTEDGNSGTYPASGNDEMTSVYDVNSSRMSYDDLSSWSALAQSSLRDNDTAAGDDDSSMSQQRQNGHYRMYDIVGPLIYIYFSTANSSDAGFSVDLLFQHPDYSKASFALF